MEDMCYERRRAEACVDESAHHALEWIKLDITILSTIVLLSVFLLVS